MKFNRALTQKWGGVVNVLPSPIGISEAFEPHEGDPMVAVPQVKQYQAIWDTGATASVISSNVVRDLGLKPIGVTRVHTANGTADQPSYMVNFFLPNRVIFGLLRVTEAPLVGSDALLGMDIISKGDLCISNFDGKTVLTFRFPSCGSFDFVSEHAIAQLPRAERRRRERERGKI